MSPSSATPFQPYQAYPPNSPPPINTLGAHPENLPYSGHTHAGSGQALVRSKRHWPLANVYFGFSGILGFKERWSLILFVVFGGALMAFCIARAEFFNVNRLLELMIPGEWYLYRSEPYKGLLMFHIYTSIFAGFWAVWQFIPAIRRNHVSLHRLNGYLTLILLIPSTVIGSVIARRAYGGAVAIQAAFYVQGILVTYSAIVGYWYVKKNTRKHRKWMLRSVVYLAASVTAKLIQLISRQIVSNVGSYYTIWTCPEVQFLQAVGHGVPDFASTYPACASDPNTSTFADQNSIHLLVHASMDETSVNRGSAVREVVAMSIFVAILIHALGVEIYIRSTENMNRFRRGFVLERTEDGDDEKPVNDL
ncbi:hypothetical protein FRB96_009585 [Tulasnella sp. 330]|nr:hypothetical protein FRB96_009585 [Tulasnella sp. 330]